MAQLHEVIRALWFLLASSFPRALPFSMCLKSKGKEEEAEEEEKEEGSGFFLRR